MSRPGSAVLVTVMLAASLTLTLPVGAQTSDGHLCGDWVPGAGFTDVAPTSVHSTDIDCIAYWGVTGQKGTFNPKRQVTRWQMALFMAKAFSYSANLPDGRDQEFGDVGGLPANYQTAINQMAQLGITSGTGSGYSPHEVVTRWQMALFLSKYVYATGSELPAGVDQGYVDIGHLPANYQEAINQLTELGVAAGTGTDRFSPDAPVLREQMATFLARVLELGYYGPITLDLECTPPLPTDPDVDPDPGTTCTGSGAETAATAFRYGNGWAYHKPFLTSTDQDEFSGSGTRIELIVDGAPISLTEVVRDLPGITYRIWIADFSGGLTGAHTFVTTAYYGGILQYRLTLNVDFQ